MDAKKLANELKLPVVVLLAASALYGAVYLAAGDGGSAAGLQIALLLASVALLLWLGLRSRKRLKAQGVKLGTPGQKVAVWVLLLVIPSVIGILLHVTDQYYDHFTLLMWLELLTTGLLTYSVGLIGFW